MAEEIKVMTENLTRLMVEPGSTMPIELSYHICDFIVTEEGEIFVLELGEANNSNFDARDEQQRKQGQSTIQGKILEHVRTFGETEYIFAPLRDDYHWGQRRAIREDDFPFLNIEKSKQPKVQVVVNDSGRLMGECHIEYMQELRAGGGHQNLVLNSVSDLYLMINRDKRVLNTLLRMSHLESLQPRTVFFDAQKDDVDDMLVLEKDTVYIIKPSDGTLGEGTLVARGVDLPAILSAIKSRDEKCLPQHCSKYDLEKMKYYCKPDTHQNILIQEWKAGKAVVAEDNCSYRATARVVFGLSRTKDDKAIIKIIDMYWKFPSFPIEEGAASSSERSISYTWLTGQAMGEKSNPNNKASLSTKDEIVVGDTITNVLQKIAQASFQYDVRDYLITLYNKKQYEDIRYYLTGYARIRIDRIDAHLISLLLTVDRPLARSFLITQAKYHALPHHLTYRQMEVYTWLQAELPYLENSVLEDLKAFMRGQEEKLKELNVEKKEYNEFAARFLARIASIQKERSEQTQSRVVQFSYEKSKKESTRETYGCGFSQKQAKGHRYL